MNKKYIEINMDESILEYERQILAGVNVPSLLPVNIISENEKNTLCFITTGYKTITEFDITDIETLCNIVKSFVRTLVISEQYLLIGGKHFLNADMIFYDEETKSIKLVFGSMNDSGCDFGDPEIVIAFIENLKKCITDNVFIGILNKIIGSIKRKNPEIKKIVFLIEEIERKWYCRNFIPVRPFSGVQGRVN